ncbi:MAG: DUF4249 family protein [Cyclobacteriaceae bacterium]
MKMFRHTFIVLVSVVVFVSCDKAINPDLPEIDPFVNINAWVTNEMQIQEISVEMTRPYLDNGPIPVVEDATVTLTNETKDVSMDFVFSSETGKYQWDPNVLGDSIGSIGDQFILTVEQGGITYESSTALNRVPAIDSITFEFNKADIFSDGEDYYWGDFWALDPEGSGDTYWIKSYKNGVYLNKPYEINIAWDAAFSDGTEFDNKQFIQPIRNLMNPFDEEETQDISLEPAYDLEDTAYVEIHSVSNEAWFFISRVITETNRTGGFGALFATPLADVPTNFEPSQSNVNVAGFFNVAAVASREQVVDESSIRDNIPD